MGPAFLLLLLLLATSAAADEPPAVAVPASQCAAAIVSISPCLAHVAVVAPPATPSAAPTAVCCAAFLRAVYGGGGRGGGEVCFCHLVRDPLLLGFPIDASRLGSLFSTCAAPNATAVSSAAAAATAGSFTETCRESKSLPPMHSSPTDAPKLSPTVAPWSKPSAMGPTLDVPSDRSDAAPASSPARHGEGDLSAAFYPLVVFLLFFIFAEHC